MKQSSNPINDGIVTIYAVTDGASAGNAPLPVPERKVQLRYHRRTIGIQRYYTALQASARVDLLLRVPYRPDVSAQDIAVPESDTGSLHQYRITLVQVPEDIQPPMMDLTLEKLEENYDLP